MSAGARLASSTMPAWAFAAALAGLPFMGWDRLKALLATSGGDARRAWQRVGAGEGGRRGPGPRGRFQWRRCLLPTSVQR